MSEATDTEVTPQKRCASNSSLEDSQRKRAKVLDIGVYRDAESRSSKAVIDNLSKGLKKQCVLAGNILAAAEDMYAGDELFGIVEARCACALAWEKDTFAMDSSGKVKFGSRVPLTLSSATSIAEKDFSVVFRNKRTDRDSKMSSDEEEDEKVVDAVDKPKEEGENDEAEAKTKKR